MIPTPIRQVLSTFQTNGVQALLMGGQACVLYGAAQVSKDVDLVLLAEAGNFVRLQRAPEMLVELARRFPGEVCRFADTRPLLRDAIAGDLPALRAALDVEARAEKEKDRAYWAPLKQELQSFRRAEAGERGISNRN